MTSVIIPIHKFDDEISELLNKAVESVAAQEKIETLPEIYLVFPEEIKKEINAFVKKAKKTHKVEFNLLINDGKTDFQSQINFGASKIETEYFSILELDDEYSTTYFHNVERYVKYNEDVDVFLTMIVEVNEKHEALKVTNEIVWSQQYIGENGEMGFLNQNAISQNTDFKISGAVIKREEFINIGGLKSNIELTFNYEFLLRALNNACKIYTIPKIGYKHLSMRKSGLFSSYGETLSLPERRFWYETAVKEANFTTDRNIDTSSIVKTIEVEK